MSALFSRPKPPVVEMPKETEAPMPPPPPLPPPAAAAPSVQEEEARVRSREAKKGRKATILTSPVGVATVNGAGPKTLLGG